MDSADHQVLVVLAGALVALTGVVAVIARGLWNRLNKVYDHLNSVEEEVVTPRSTRSSGVERTLGQRVAAIEVLLIQHLGWCEQNAGWLHEIRELLHKRPADRSSPTGG